MITIIFLLILLVTPSLIIYGLIKMSKHPRGLSSETLDTQGMPLDVVAPIYDRCCAKIGLGSAFRHETIRYAELKRGEHVLDVGCGTGVLTRFAAAVVGSGGRAIGIDPAAKMIEIAKKNAEKEKSQADFKLAVIESLPFEENSFDCVLSSAMLHHLPPYLKHNGLAEVFRVLKPGGRIVLVDIDRPQNPLWWILFWPFLFWHFTKDQILGRIGEYLQGAGFQNVGRVGTWFGFLGFWKAYKVKT